MMVPTISVLLILNTIVLFTPNVVGDVDDAVGDSDFETAESLRRGIDGSWPMQLSHQAIIETAKNFPLYDQYMKGCYDTYSKELCDENEAIRMERNSHQPQWVPRNYTTAGYAQVPAPTGPYTILRDHWDRFSQRYMRPEVWDAANVYTNHWAAATQVLPLENPDGTTPLSQHLSVQNRQKIIEQVQEVLERWTGVSLQPTSLYGIRSYTNGSILAPHVDRYVLFP